MAKFAPLTEEEKASVSKFAPLTKEEKASVKAEDVEAAKPSGFESFARGAAQGVAFNFADEIAGVIGAIGRLGEDKPFSELREEETAESRAAFKAAQEESPALFGAGQIGGAVGTLLIPGGALAKGTGLVGKGAQAIGKASTLTKAGVGGAAAEIGALETDVDDPAAVRLNEVARAAMTGSFTGIAGQGVFNAIGKAIGPRVQETLAKLGAEAFSRRAESRAVKAAFGQNKREFTKLMQSGRLHKTGRALLDSDPGTGRPIVRAFKNVEDIAQNAAESAEIQGKKIGDIVDSFDMSFDKALTAFRKSPDFDDLTTTQQMAAVKEIKDKFLVSPTRIADKVRERAAALRDNPGEFQLMNKLNKLADDFDGIQPYSLRRAQEVKGTFKWNPLDPDKNQFGQEATNDVRRIVNEEMERVVDQVSSKDFNRFLIDAVGAEKAEVSSKVLDEYRTAKDLYRSYKTAADAAKERALSDLANRFVSPSDTGAGLAVLGGTLASGGTGASSLLTAAAASSANKFFRTKGSSAAAVGFDKIASMLNRSPDSLGKFGDRLIDALQNQGGAGLAAEHLKLLADPDYKLTVEQLTKPSGR